MKDYLKTSGKKVIMVTFVMRGGHTRGSNNNNNNNNNNSAPCNIYYARVVAGKNLVFCIGGYKQEGGCKWSFNIKFVPCPCKHSPLLQL